MSDNTSPSTYSSDSYTQYSVSSLVIFLEKKDADFTSLVLEQIRELRKQIKKPSGSGSSELSSRHFITTESGSVQPPIPVERHDEWKLARATVFANGMTSGPGASKYMYM